MPPVANFALLTVFIADVIPARMAATVEAMAARFAGNGTLCDCLIPAAIATPELMAISASASTFDAMAAARFFSSASSKRSESAPTACPIAFAFAVLISTSFFASCFMLSL